METVVVNSYSDGGHVSQILCGFHMLKDEYNVMINPQVCKKGSDCNLPACVEVIYNDKKIIYDVDDGYQNIDGIRFLLSDCDFYFKRSFSSKTNEKFLSDYKSKIFPLGFNYYVTYAENPFNSPQPAWKRLIKFCLGYKKNTYFTSDVFEGTPKENISGTPKILFYTRLWKPDDTLSAELNEERRYINSTRIQIIRKLKERFGDAFEGGVAISPLASELCPDLILSPFKTRRDNYLKLLHAADICIGSMGLHESIGWKTAEYVAAAKAIVTEEMKYGVPGNFQEGQNYFSFSTVNECLQIVESLVEDKEKIYAMQKSNHEYYKNYLHPRVLIKNTLDIVDRYQ